MMTEHRAHPQGQATSPARGFSVTEMALVLVLIAIIVGIAIPILRTPLASSDDRNAQASILLAYESARIASRSLGGFTAEAPALVPHAPELTFRGPSNPSTSAREVSVAVDTEATTPRAAALGIAALSDSGTCWLLLAIPEGPNRGVAYARDDVVGGLDCTGARALRDITPPDRAVEGLGADAGWKAAEVLP